MIALCNYEVVAKRIRYLLANQGDEGIWLQSLDLRFSRSGNHENSCHFAGDTTGKLRVAFAS